MFKLFIFFFLSSLTANVEEIEIYLERKKERKSLYLQKISEENARFSPEYTKEIENVILFDLEHLDKILLLSQTPLEKQLSMLQLQPKIKNNLLLFEAYTPKRKIEFPPITLLGNIDQDRREIHQILDAFYQKFFHTKSLLTTTLLYSCRVEKGNYKWASEIWSSDYDGHNPKPLIQDEHYHLFPCPIPFSKDFIYVSFRSGRAKIYSNNSLIPYITLSGNQILPSISRDGNKIAFISDAAGRPDLFIQEKDQKPIQLYSYPRATQASPTFDPTGKKIAFVSDKDGAPRIYILEIPNLYGKRPEALLISKKNRENTCPSWSTDGTKLAYSAKTEGIRQIWVYDFEAREEMQITVGKENKESPTWAIDSSHLVYNTEEKSELYLINIKTKKPIKITKGPGQKRFASWQTY